MHLILAGDFNRHHPLWDEDRNHHLFTMTNLQKVQVILDLQTRLDLMQVLPKGVPTLVASNSGNYTRPDNVFVSNSISHMITTCAVQPERRPAKTDHMPILTTLDTSTLRNEVNTCRNYRKVDWEAFRRTLECKLNSHTTPHEIDSADELQTTLTRLCASIESTVNEHVPLMRPCPRTKRWWTDECAKARQRVNKLGSKAHI